MAKGANKRALFVAAYLGEARQNAARAAELAGYAEPWDRQGSRLLKRPDVQAEIAAWRKEIREKGIAVVENRLAAQNERWTLLQQVVRERAADPSMAAIPGGTTGLMIRRGKLVKVYEGSEDEAPESDEDEVLFSAKRSQVVYEYELDTGLLKELRELEKHSAQELGQWAEKHEISGPNGGPIPYTLNHIASLTPEQLDARLADAEAHLAAGGVPEEPGALHPARTGSELVEAAGGGSGGAVQA